MRTVLRGLWLELRVVPVLLWSFSAITLGTAAAGGGLHGWRYLGAVLLGVLIQGLLAHTVNEIEDWRSGTDRHPSPRVLSGGSKVLVAGLLNERLLWWAFWAALALTTALGVVLVAVRGAVVLPFGLAGVAGAVVYSLPPVRAAYRPFVGEGVAFGCVVLCVVGAAVLQDGGRAAIVAPLAVAAAAYAVSMLMLHHLLDHDADACAVPRKVTTIVRLGVRGGHRYGVAWSALALAAAAVAAAQEAGVLPLVAAYAVGLGAAVRCRPDDPASVTKAELAVTFAGIGGALVSAAVLAPPLAWAALLAVAAVAAELRLALRPAAPEPEVPA